MAGTFVPTGAYSNLSRLELEQLRKADFFAGAKALTVGDSALSPEGVVGPGSINAEPYLTSQFTTIQELLLTPAPQPGLNLFAQTFAGGRAASITVTGVVTISGLVNPIAAPGSYIVISGASNPANNGTFKATFATATSVTIVNPNATTDSNNGSIVWQFVDDTGNWYGPTFVGGSVGGRAQGQATGTLQWTDLQNCFGSETGVPGAGMGVQTGDVLIVKYSLVGQNNNQYAVGTVAAVVNTALSGTFHVTNGLNTVTASVSQTLAQGQRVVFASQPSVYYVIQSGTGTSLTLSSNYTGTNNAATAGTSPTSLTLSSVNNSYGGSPTVLSVSSDTYSYLIVRPNAVQLFAIPGSGATGNEQSFLTVVPGSPLHNSLAPTVDQINRDRLLNVIPGQYGLNSTVDRADAVFSAPAPQATSNLLGYRIVLYPDNGSGTGPNLAAPIATLSPVIDPAIPATDQRFTVDYSAGVIRFSCEPKIGGQIKVAGGVNSTTGRLNLYAVFWAINSSFAPGASSSLYVPQTTQEFGSPPARTYFNGSSWAFDSPNYLTLNTITIPVGGDVLSGGGATISAASGGLVTLTGLSGMYPNIAGSITLSGASSSGNNGTFLVDQYVSNSSVIIINPNGVFPDTNSGIIGWQLPVLPLPLMTLDVPDPTTSLVQRANAAFVLTCGDGTVSFGDFNGSDAFNQAVAYWQGLSSPPKTCHIHLKHGTYTSTQDTLVGWNGSSSTAGYHLIITGDSKATTTLNGGFTGTSKFFILGAGSQITLENLTLASTVSGGVNGAFGGSFRARGCAFLGTYFSWGQENTVLLDGVAPLKLSSQSVLPDLILCEDCEFDFVTNGGLFGFTAYSAKNCTWRDCSFATLGGPNPFQFSASTTPTTYSHFTWEQCTFQVQGVSSSSTTAINGAGGVIQVLPGTNDLMMTLDHFLYDECTVTSTDTTRGSVVLMHLFPLSYNASNANNRVQIGTVHLRGGTWSIGSGRGNDFAPFFLMCSNPIIENVKINGGGTKYTGMGSSPGFRGNGAYTDAMRYALTGTNGYAASASFLATIAASGQGLFSNLTGAGGYMSSITSGTVTFTDFIIASQLSAGFQGLQITVWGASQAVNNGTFPITGFSGGSLLYTNASATTAGETQNGSLSWSVTATTQTGMIVRNLEVNNIPVQSYTGDLCLVGPLLTGGPVDVSGVLVTNMGGPSAVTNTPQTRIYLRPGAQYTVVSNVATVAGVTNSSGVGASNGSNGVFRGITWAPVAPTATQGVTYIAQTGTGSVSTGVVCIGYTGSIHIEDLKVLPPLAFDPTRSFGAQQDVIPMSGITCTELWGTVTSPPQRGTLRLKNSAVVNTGVDFYNNASISLSDFQTIDAESLKTSCNLNNYQGSANTIVGIQVYPQYTQRGSGGIIIPSGVAGGSPIIIFGPFSASAASLGVASGGNMTVTGLTNMTAADVGTYITFSGCSNSSNNGSFYISSIVSSTSVVVLQSNAHAADAHNGQIVWALANNVTSNWSLNNCRVEVDNVHTGYSISGIQAFWTLGTAQSSLGSGGLSNGTVQGCYVQITTNNADFTSILPECFNFGSVDQNYDGQQVPALNCFNNTGVAMSSAGPSPGNFSTFQYIGGLTTPPGTQSAITSGVTQCRGFWTSFSGGITTGDLMVFNSGFLKTP